MKTIFDFNKKKMNGEKITMITCYDYTSARILSATTVDCLLVGDSLAMTMHGFKHTVSATISMMCFHTEAVARGAGDKLIISDLPFLSYRKSLSRNVESTEKLIKAGAHAVKLENAAGNLTLIKHLVESGIPVMGHLGLTGQSVYTLGGYRVQGKTDKSANQIQEDAFLLQEAGCFAVVLECIPDRLAKVITKSLAIPTIGIGAGGGTDGQVLVFQDLLGLNIDFKPKFVKSFLNGFEQIKNGVNDYVNEVKNGQFPKDEHCYES